MQVDTGAGGPAGGACLWLQLSQGVLRRGQLSQAHSGEHPKLLHRQFIGSCYAATDTGMETRVRWWTAETCRVSVTLTIAAPPTRLFQHPSAAPASCVSLQTVQAPLLCICARRDPLVVEDLVEVPRSAAKANPHILTVITKHGGHMGWITRMSEEPWYLTLYFQYIKAVQAAKEDGSGVKTAAVAAGQQEVAVPSGEGENVQAGTSGQQTEPMHVPGTGLEAGAATQGAADGEVIGADACSNGAGKSQAIPDSQGGAATPELLASVKVA